MAARSSKSTENSHPLVRKQFLLTPEQNARLRAQSLASGVSEADIVREGIDLALTRTQTTNDSWKSAWLQAAGIWHDRDDLDRLYDERRRLRAKRRSDGSRTQS